jgi:hypothetical protein
MIHRGSQMGAYEDAPVLVSGDAACYFSIESFSRVTLLVIFLLNHSVDERILGGGDFVDELKQHVELQTKMQGTYGALIPRP